MAASMTVACGRSPILLSKALNKTKVYSLCKQNVKAIPPLLKCFMCSADYVTPKERKSVLTSTRLWGRSPNTVASAQVARTAELGHISCVTSVFKCHTQGDGVASQCRSMSTEKLLNSKKVEDCKGLPASPEARIQSKDARSKHDISNKISMRKKETEKKENIKTIPNLLTTARMASAPLLGYMVVCENFGWALGLFVAAGITDLLDGYIARNYPNQTSALGSALDPLADKLLVTILFVSLTTVGLIPLPLTGLIVFRDISLIAGGFYIRYRSLPPPITLSRYFDVAHATVNLTPTFISKLNTGLQLSLVACSLAAPVFGFVDHLCLQALWWVTGATTFLSGTDYLWSWKKYVTLLEKDQHEL